MPGFRLFGGKFLLGLLEDLSLCLGGELCLIEPGEEVRAAGHGTLVALLLPPGGHVGVVAGEKDLGDFAAVPLLRTGVLGMLQQAVPMGLLHEALLVRQDAGDHAADGVTDGHGRDLAAGEDKVAQGDLLVHALVQKALVHALIMPADQDDVVPLLLQLPGYALVEGAAAGGHKNGVGVWVAAFLADMVPAAVERVRLHDGPPAPAIGIIVHLHLLIGGVVPDLVGHDGEETPLLGPAQDADIQHGVHRLREKGHDIKSHRWPSLPKCVPPSGLRPGPRSG